MRLIVLLWRGSLLNSAASVSMCDLTVRMFDPMTRALIHEPGDPRYEAPPPREAEEARD